MTEEQLFHIAEEFANKITPIANPYNVLQNVAHTTAIQAYIAGYNSRNEEIRDLETKVSALQTAYEAETDVLENKIIELRALENKLDDATITNKK